MFYVFTSSLGWQVHWRPSISTSWCMLQSGTVMVQQSCRHDTAWLLLTITITSTGQSSERRMGQSSMYYFFLSNKEIWKFSCYRKEQLHRFVSYMIKHSKGYLGISWRKHQVLNYSYCLTMLLLATFFVQFWLSFTTLWADIILQLISVWFNDVMAAILSVFLVVQCYSCNFPSIFSK